MHNKKSLAKCVQMCWQSVCVVNYAFISLEYYARLFIYVILFLVERKIVKLKRLEIAGRGCKCPPCF